MSILCESNFSSYYYHSISQLFFFRLSSVWSRFLLLPWTKNARPQLLFFYRLHHRFLFVWHSYYLLIRNTYQRSITLITIYGMQILSRRYSRVFSFFDQFSPPPLPPSLPLSAWGNFMKLSKLQTQGISKVRHSCRIIRFLAPFLPSGIIVMLSSRTTDFVSASSPPLPIY